MIRYKRTTLSNGLTVIVHEDPNTPLAAINLLYDVGARDENPDRTGFAHLFEHLMFGGSENIPDYDGPLQLASGENNAFTNNDITNYYLTLPAANLETGFWLESDRMNNLAFSPKSLEVQRHVVIEEFKQRYLNQPYGDVWLLMRPLAYKVHPYQWATIGKDIAHIEQATLDDVKNFFYTHYCPGNAILTVAGNVQADDVFSLADKWFSPITRSSPYVRRLQAEPAQEGRREMRVEKDVPFDALYMAFHGPSRTDPEFYATDLLTDVLSRGHSSRLYHRLVKERKLFSEVHAYSTGDRDKGLVVAEGKLVEGVTMENAEAALRQELELFCNEHVLPAELEKVKNKVESTMEFSEMDLPGRALNLAISEWLGDVSLVNTEVEKFRKVTFEEIRETARSVFREENCSVLYYMKKN